MTAAEQTAVATAGIITAARLTDGLMSTPRARRGEGGTASKPGSEPGQLHGIWGIGGYLSADAMVRRPRRNIDVRARSGNREWRPHVQPAMKAKQHVLVRVPQAGRPACALAVRTAVLFASGFVILSGCAGGPFRPVIKTSALRAADRLVPF